MDVVIPAIADGVHQVEILALLVRVGQHVLAKQPVLELEAGKASFELPSPATGKIEEIRVGIGDDVRVGEVVLTLKTMDDRSRQETAPPVSTSTVAPSPPSVLASTESRKRLFAPVAHEPCVRASPAARTRARELGVDIDALAAESDGRVTIEQVEAHAHGAFIRAAASLAGRAKVVRHLELDAQTEWRMASHAALHRTIDVTCLEAARQRYRDAHESSPRLTLATFVLKACAIALRQHPRMNSTLIRHGRALAIKRYVHIGVAVDTRRSSALPLLRHVDQRSLVELANELERLPCTVREDPEQCEGSTFSLTNWRSFVGSGFIPTIHAAQVGALGMCRARNEGGRTMLPLSLAYDSRVNDEAAASSFLATIAELLHDPLAMLLHA